MKNKIFVLSIIIIVSIALAGCSQLGPDVGEGEHEELKDLEAVNGEMLMATFENGDTVEISNFDPKPLPLGEKTRVSFIHDGGTYKEEVEYTITLEGDINQSTMKIANTKSQTEDISKVVLFFPNNYKTTEVIDGKFSVEIDEEEPGGIAFLDDGDNYIGHLMLEDGLNSFPTKAISKDTGEIDLGEIDFDEEGVGTPTEDPFSDMDQTEKSMLAVSGSFFSAVVRSPEVVEKIVKKDQNISFELKYFPSSNEFKNKEAQLNTDNVIESHRIGIEFDPEISDYEELSLDYPGDGPKDVEPKIDDEEESPGEGVSYPGVGIKDGGRAAIEGPPVPSEGNYSVSNDASINFEFGIPDIQNEAEEHLVFPVPEVNVNEKGIIERISWKYETKNGDEINNPENVIEDVNIQINAKSKDNDDLKGDYDWASQGAPRIYNSDQLDEGQTSHKISEEEIYWEDIGNIDMAYDDIYNIHYVVDFQR